MTVAQLDPDSDPHGVSLFEVSVSLSEAIILTFLLNLFSLGYCFLTAIG